VRVVLGSRGVDFGCFGPREGRVIGRGINGGQNYGLMMAISLNVKIVMLMNVLFCKIVELKQKEFDVINFVKKQVLKWFKGTIYFVVVCVGIQRCCDMGGVVRAGAAQSRGCTYRLYSTGQGSCPQYGWHYGNLTNFASAL